MRGFLFIGGIMGTLGKTWKMPPRSEEYRKKVSEWMKAYGKSKEGLKKIEKMAELRRGKSTKAWTPDKRKEESKKKQSETKKKNIEDRKGIFYIIDDKIYTLHYLTSGNRVLGKSVKEVIKELKNFKPATQEEIEQWLGNHLLDSIMELEEMKDSC